MKIEEYRIIKQSDKMKNNYLLYARKSSESEDKQVESIPDQINVLNTLINQKGLSVFKQYTESASAKAPGRKSFNEMLTLIDNRDDIKGIVCWKLNRLFRNPVDEGQVRWLLENKKIDEIVTPTKTYFGCDSDFLMAIEGAQAQRFIRDLREDTARGINNKLEKGNAPIFAPPGYKNDTYKRQGEKTISPHRMYFDLMKEIFNLALTGKFSTSKLYEKALNMGIKNNRGKEISRSEMYFILRNPFYCGKFLYAGQLYQGVHKPMITVNEFDTLQEILDGRTITHKITQDFIMRGFVKCGYCNYQIIGERHTKKSGLIFDYYTCCMRKKGNKCKQPYVRSEVLESQFLDFLGKVKLSKSFVTWAIKWLKNAEMQDNEVRKKQLDSHTKEYKRLGNQINRLMDLYTNNQIENEEYISHKQRYLQQRVELNKKIKSFDYDWQQWTNLSIKTFKFASEAVDRWNNGTFEDKQLILSIIGSNFVLKDNNLTIKPKTPFLMIKNSLEKYKKEDVSSNSVINPKTGVEDFENTVLGG